MIAYGLIAGLTMQEASTTEPGFVVDLFLARRRYDDEQHGIKRTSATEWSD